MIDKKIWADLFREEYYKKTGQWLPDDHALDFFNRMLAIVGGVYE